MATAAQSIGAEGERLAREYLADQGLRFVAANWSCKAGEVDLIMLDSSTMVFVEVRTRAPTDFGEGFETVSWEKQRKLARTAQYYQQREKWWGDVRFDVVSIVYEQGAQPLIEHIAYAFEVPI